MPSDWIRCLLTSAEPAGQDGRPVPEELRELHHQLSRVGNNINQLAVLPTAVMQSSVAVCWMTLNP